MLYNVNFHSFFFIVTKLIDPKLFGQSLDQVVRGDGTRQIDERQRAVTRVTTALIAPTPILPFSLYSLFYLIRQRNNKTHLHPFYSACLQELIFIPNIKSYLN